jgi:hypothetical protein
VSITNDGFVTTDEQTFWDLVFVARATSAVLAAGLAKRVVEEATETADLALQARRDMREAWLEKYFRGLS